MSTSHSYCDIVVKGHLEKIKAAVVDGKIPSE